MKNKNSNDDMEEHQVYAGLDLGKHISHITVSIRTVGIDKDKVEKLKKALFETMSKWMLKKNLRKEE